MISNLHYISQESPFSSHIEAIENAISNGVNWVQLRVKNKPKDEVLTIAKTARTICSNAKVKLIINDSIEIAHEVGADGVHLGKSDPAPDYAREVLGIEKIVGGTANTIEDIQYLVDCGVDYIGLGPFRFTGTKQKLSPILGLKGYKSIIHHLNYHDIQIPVIAIGGILEEDLQELKNTGVYGVAISGAINNADKPRVLINRVKNIF